MYVSARALVLTCRLTHGTIISSTQACVLKQQSDGGAAFSLFDASVTSKTSKSCLDQLSSRKVVVLR